MWEWLLQLFQNRGTDRFFGTAPTPYEHMTPYLKDIENMPERFFGKSTPTNHTFFEKLFEWIGKGLSNFFQYIRPALPELITLALMICALGLMITGENHKWYSRLAMVGFAGAAILIMT